MIKRQEKSQKLKNEPVQKPVRDKKPKSDEYMLKRSQGMKILRIVLWVMICFIFLRGVFTIFSRNTDSEVEQMIRNFRATLSEEKELNNEAMAFAQNFAREYLTYEAKGEEQYRDRIRPYVNEGVYNQTGIMDFKNSAEAVYAEAYRLEQYSETQLDVYVLADIKYSCNVLNDDKATYSIQDKEEQTVLKVPLYVEHGSYVVESLPMFVTDTVKVGKYPVKAYTGTALKDTQAAEVKTAVENFLAAYYSQDATVIDYYLSGSAAKKNFTGLNGRYTFGKISMINSYQEPGQDIICLVEYTVKDSVNDAVIAQKINLSIKMDGNRYYINSIDTRTGNLKL